MTGSLEPPDARQRDEALDATRSFIVQAPAGSGKTELLIQRYLRLLACVQEPEEVLAVTFTRKAAGEMRSRIISALNDAASPDPPSEPHLRRSWGLARDILADDARRSWQLPRHPARLSISTIDSVNAWLAGRAPLSAGASAVQGVTDAADRLYEEAARATLDHIGDDDAAGASVAALLRHLDNDAGRFVRLLVGMLPRRDQWLRQVFAADDERTRMEEPLHTLVTQVLGQVAVRIEPEQKSVLTGLLASAGARLRESGRDSPLCEWNGRREFPRPVPAEIPAWKALAHALLTEQGQWRRSITIQQGFPPRSAEKVQMQELLADLGTRTALREQLVEVQKLPPATYSEGQWHILQALISVLKLAAAELKLVFAARGTSDFPEVAADALAALGSPIGPSELGLALDHRVQHILVDEFQDTSLSQLELLRRLTAGWEPGDGRTLFLVGDPMQSIYRFREAEVGIFMQVRDHGLGHLAPGSLRLTANFRSDPRVVEWVNSVFSQVLPTEDDLTSGAVRFAASRAVRSRGSDAGGVRIHWLSAGGDAEASRVLEIVTDGQRQRDKERTCILVRSRGHARRILAALRSASVAFVAPEIENLEFSSVAQDLLALTRALLHPGDRLAWIGVLRAPWCGLSLLDLHTLLAADLQRPVPEILREQSAQSAPLSMDGRRSLARLLPVIERTARARGRRALRDLIEGAWLDLAGPATLREEAEYESAEAFLRLLESVDTGGDCAEPGALLERMTSRKGSLGSGEPGVQVMTMHKAKGLEFDTVILPGLGKRPHGRDASLLASLDVILPSGEQGTILAPMAAVGEQQDRLYDYLAAVERRKQAAETRRLLYVACTRAKTSLHVLAHATVIPDDADGWCLRRPDAGSLLECLWPVLAAEAPIHPPESGAADMRKSERTWIQPLIRRLPPQWQAPPAAPALAAPASETLAQTEKLAYEWVSNWAMCAGSVVHYWLKVITEKGVEDFSARRIRADRPLFRRQLISLGISTDDLERATDRVVDALLGVIADERGRWILSAAHAQSQCELPLTTLHNGRFRNVVIDRTFVAPDGYRWLIDYKISSHEGGDLAAFLVQEAARHAEQLRTYRQALTALWNEPVRSALYFPLLGEFVEVSLDDVAG